METTIKLNIPGLPNNIRAEHGVVIPITDLTEEQLREIGMEWTEALVAKAKKIKAMNTPVEGGYL